jgi:signal transduction histidine kinase
MPACSTPTCAPGAPQIGPEPDLEALHSAYVADSTALVAQRVHVVVAILAVAMGLAALIEWFVTPARTPVTRVAYAVELATGAAAVGLLRIRRVREWSRTIALGLCVGLVGVIAWHVSQSGGPPERLSGAYTCLLTGVVLLLPWGWRAQLALALVAVGGLASATWSSAIVVRADDPIHPFFAFMTSGSVTVVAAAYLERYRRDAFVRERLLRHSVARQQADYLLLDVIQRVQSRFIASGDAGALFSYLLGDLLGLTGSAYGFIAEVYHAPGGEPYLRTHALTDIAWSDDTRRLYAEQAPNLEFRNLRTLFGVAILSGAPVIANSPATDDRRGGLPPGHPPLDAFLGVPFRHGGEIVGMAGLANRPGGYDQSVVTFLQPLLATCGSMIAAHRQVREREAVEDALAEEGQITAAVARAGRELNASLDASVVLERLCHLTGDLLACQVSATFLWQPDTDVYVPVAITGMSDAQLGLARAVQVNREFISMVFSQAEQSDSAEIGDVPAARLAEIGLGDFPSPRFLCLALRQDGEILGIQVVCAVGRAEPFTRAERRIADGVARMASMSLMNARLLGDLQRANRLKSEFVSTMSHELRTPLNVILGYADMACDGNVGEGDRRECLDRIVNAGRDLLGLIESTLEIGRIETGNDAVRLESVPVAELWSELGTACDQLPRPAGVELRWHPAPRLHVRTDPRKLTVVIRNLVGNALKFTEHGAVEADLLVGDGRLTFRVADTGIGIRPEDQRAIFEMFRQADGSDSRRYGGTGLGLYIVRRFVEQLGGTITVESTLGEGSVFTATLPAAVVTDAGRAATDASGAADTAG